MRQVERAGEERESDRAIERERARARASHTHTQRCQYTAINPKIYILKIENCVCVCLRERVCVCVVYAKREHIGNRSSNRTATQTGVEHNTTNADTRGFARIEDAR